MVSKLVTFADAVLTVSRFFRTALDETLANTYFLVTFQCWSGQLIRSLEISGNKNNLRLK